MSFAAYAFKFPHGGTNQSLSTFIPNALHIPKHIRDSFRSMGAISLHQLQGSVSDLAVNLLNNMIIFNSLWNELLIPANEAVANEKCC